MRRSDFWTGEITNGNDVCLGKSTLEFHTTGFSEVKRTAFAITYLQTSFPSRIN
jgi:hypothetical protein